MSKDRRSISSVSTTDSLTTAVGVTAVAGTLVFEGKTVGALLRGLSIPIPILAVALPLIVAIGIGIDYFGSSELSGDPETIVKTSSNPDLLEKLPGDDEAFEADYFPGRHEAALSKKQQETKAKQQREQKPQKNSIKDKKTHWPDNKWRNLKKKFSDKNFPPRKPVFPREETPYLTRFVYEEVPLPEEHFNHTSIVLVNRYTQGLMHSFARHSGQWVNASPWITGLMRRLPSEVREAIIQIHRMSDELSSEQVHARYVALEYAIVSSEDPLGKRFY